MVVLNDSSAVLLKSQSHEVTKNSRENDGAVSETYPYLSLQSASLTAARSLFLSKLSDTEKLFRRVGPESNSTTPEAPRNSSNISIRFSKKTAEDSEDESQAVLAIKVPPPETPVATDVEPFKVV